MRKFSLSALTLIAALAASGAARADCCNDFLSCLGAVASAGLSCQIESLIASVTTLKNAVETLGNSLSTEVANVISQAQQGVTSAASDLKQVRLDAANELKNSADQAHALAYPPQQAIALKPGMLALQPVAPAGAILHPVRGAPSWASRCALWCISAGDLEPSPESQDRVSRALIAAALLAA